LIRSHKLEHALRVIKYGVLEPLLSLAVGHTGFLFPARNGFIPPDWMNFAGGGDFQTIGRENVELLKRCAALQPYERVLEIGCGIGRNAAFLAEYLDSGTYAGFDVVRTGIIWCNRHIASQHPTFAFRRVDVRNAFYNPWGGIPSTVFSFPYEDYCFDLVFDGAGALYTADNGPDRDDELNRVVAGGNYGWPMQLGATTAPEFVAPLHVWSRIVAPGGMAFYTGTQFPAAFRGKLFVVLFGDTFSQGPSDRAKRVQLVDLAATPPSFEDFAVYAFAGFGNPVDVAQGPDGSLFVSDIFQGIIYRIRYTR